MDKTIQEVHHHQRILKWAEIFGATQAAIRYKASRKTVHKWKSAMNGSIRSLKDRYLTLRLKEALIKTGTEYHRTWIAMPRHSGKVERQHRTDEPWFYQHIQMYSLEGGRRQLVIYQRKSNNPIMICLQMRSPNQVLHCAAALCGSQRYSAQCAG